MKLWGDFTNLLVGKKLLMKKGAVLTVTSAAGVESNIDLAELAALDGIAATDLAKIDGITNGTVTASKAAVVDANKDIGDFRNLDAVNFDAGASGTAGSVDVFPATASKGKFTISCTDQTGDTAVTMNANAMGQATTVNIPDPGAAAGYVVMTTAALALAEADVLQGATAGTQVASKAVIADANVNTGVSKVTQLHIGASGSETQVTATGAEINRACDVSTRIVNATSSTLTVTEADHDGKTIVLDLAAGIAVTLPAASAGLKFRFVVKTTFTGAASIKSVAGADIMIGHALMGNDTNDSVVDWQSLAASTNDTIDLFGTANSTGGIAGQVVTIEGLAANLWYVEIRGDAAGTEASPFSNTVA